MAEVYNPKGVIENLEKFSIHPYQYLTPTLAVIIKKDAQQDEVSYLKSLQRKAKEYGAKILVSYVLNVHNAALVIQNLRSGYEVNGIIILSSFGEEIDRALSNLIPSRLDLDCVSSATFGKLITNTSPIGFRFGPCTSVACYKILEDIYKTDDFKYKSIGIVNRSLRVGRPLAEILTQHNGTATVYHSKSNIDLKQHDAVICAVGKPNYFTSESFREGQIVIDVGINALPNNKVCGDVDFENVKTTLGEKGIITPVPGCCGQLTTTILFAKLFVSAAELAGERNEQNLSSRPSLKNYWVCSL